MKLVEIVTRSRAGFIPYVIEDGEPVFYFMVPSKEEFGGTKPQIAKGQIDHSENARSAALREAQEELGLKASNLKNETIKLAWRGNLRGSSETYEITVFIGEVENKKDFDEPHHETGDRRWMTIKDFREEGHEPHLKIVRTARNLIRDGDKNENEANQ